ncbi:MAG: GNAT family N-acetyltransferase, partial [Candidatus Thorarchaeota archaeon]
ISWDVRGGLNDGVGEITALGVNQAHRRQGIARLLVDEVIKDANQVFGSLDGKLRVLFLFMKGSNETARLFYNSLGFNEVASIPSFYPNESASIFIRYF